MARFQLTIETNNFQHLIYIGLLWQLMNPELDDSHLPDLEGQNGDETAIAVNYVRELFNDLLSGPYVSPAGLTFYRVADAEITNQRIVKMIQANRL